MSQLKNQHQDYGTFHGSLKTSAKSMMTLYRSIKTSTKSMVTLHRSFITRRCINKHGMEFIIMEFVLGRLKFSMGKLLVL